LATRHRNDMAPKRFVCIQNFSSIEKLF
jgi:hypothetical protein